MGLIVGQNPQSPSAQRGPNVAKLEEVIREAMASWLAGQEKPKNAEKHGFLTQLFRVLYKEARYRQVELDARATVCINQSAGNINYKNDDDGDSDPSPLRTQTANTIPALPALATPRHHLNHYHVCLR